MSLFFILAAFAVRGASPTASPANGSAYESERFRVTVASENAAGLRYHAELCEKALERLAPGFQLLRPGQDKIDVRLCLAPKEFEEMTGKRSHMILAAAFPDRGVMALNATRLNMAGAEERIRTIGHEMTHLLLGRLAAGQVRVPYWLHEGLAQIMADQNDYGAEARLAWAQIWDSCIPIEDLTLDFPYSDSRAPLAYAQSASFTRFVARGHYGFKQPEEFFRYLIERPEKARQVFLWLGSTRNTGRLALQWDAVSKKSSNWLLVLGSSSLIWILVVLLFLVAYRRKRLREKTVMAHWDPWEREDEV